MDYLIISLDVPKEVSNQIRVGNLDVYSAVVDGVRELARAKRERKTAYPLVELAMTLTDSNQLHIVSTRRSLDSWKSTTLRLYSGSSRHQVSRRSQRNSSRRNSASHHTFSVAS
jgi:hypothetical protein